MNVWHFLMGLAATSCLAAENLDRGAVALLRDDASVYVGWRCLATDPADQAFNVYRTDSPTRARVKLNPQPIRDCSNFLDKTAGGRLGYYFVEALGQGDAIVALNSPRQSGSQNYISLKLRGNESAQKVGLADFDGDGKLDYLVKHPNFNTDPYQKEGYWKRSQDTYKLDAYRHDGSFMWRYDMGWAIEEGIWYSPIVVYDLDGDGKAEVFCKGGEGDPREPTGHVNRGDEFLVVLDGMTGKVRKRIPWPDREGLEQYNYWSRNLLGIAYLDGEHPHLIIERGTYKLIKLQAFDQNLNPKWQWESSGEWQSYRGQGMHGMHAADVDQDGRDEVIIGAAVIDDNGIPMWNMGKGHPDVCYVADIDPSCAGLEIFYGIEIGRQSNTVCLVEARTGKMLWGNPEITVHVHEQGMVGDINPAEPGMECYAGEAKGGTNYWLYSAAGKLLSSQSMGELSPKAVYWLDETNKALVIRGRMYRWPREEIGGIQGRIVAIADCLGDWREEIITSLNGEVRIYTSTIPSRHRRCSLMQDRLYRNDVAMQTMGYFYPPQLGKPLALE